MLSSFLHAFWAAELPHLPSKQGYRLMAQAERACCLATLMHAGRRSACCDHVVPRTFMQEMQNAGVEPQDIMPLSC